MHWQRISLPIGGNYSTHDATMLYWHRRRCRSSPKA